MNASIKFFLFLVVAVACVMALPADEAERVKKQVFYSGYGYGAYPYSGYAGYAGYTGYAGYSGYPYAGYRSLYY